ncbi:hypothetical protein DXG01_001933 [Tephrocybe rancida]|nr:hypothetical protein DXG01_001933 [Tephrocybe rancida]
MAVISTQPPDLKPRYNYMAQPPTTFTIGRTRTEEPLVNRDQIRGHLLLLHEFSALRTSIEKLDVKTEPEIKFLPKDKDRRWVWFVGLAVERFTIWCESLPPDCSEVPATTFFPPLDVLMVWHTFMLNPGAYAEDSVRLPILSNLTNSGHVLSSYFNEKHSGPPQLGANSTPSLMRANTSPTYMDINGTGYLQHDFRTIHSAIDCPSARRLPALITRRMLACRKFVDDLVREGDGVRAALAGSIRQPVPADSTIGQDIKGAFLEWVQFKRWGNATTDEWATSILKTMEYDFWKVSMSVKSYKDNKDRVSEVINSYAHGGVFSLDLVSAIMRQGSFIKKMGDLGWTDPKWFGGTDDEIVLEHAIARYHAFLDLLTIPPGTFHVPTLDIDLAWHTHQLMGEKYHRDCMKFVGRYIDHNDRVEEGKLSTSFDVTCRAWEVCFNVPYMHCGCPLPGTTIPQRLAHLRRTLHLHPSKPHTHLEAPERKDVCASTHPSEHDAVVYLGLSEYKMHLSQTERRAKVAKRAGGNAKVKEGKEMPDRYGHMWAQAFLLPIPTPYSGSNGCAAHGGRVLHSNAESGIAACVPAPVPYKSLRSSGREFSFNLLGL